MEDIFIEILFSGINIYVVLDEKIAEKNSIYFLLILSFTNI